MESNVVERKTTACLHFDFSLSDSLQLVRAVRVHRGVRQHGLSLHHDAGLPDGGLPDCQKHGTVPEEAGRPQLEAGLSAVGTYQHLMVVKFSFLVK